jgi:hypothetical protein
MENKIFVIGRNGDIRLDDESVSKRHVEIQLRGQEIYMRDLGSTNGTFLVKNGRPIRFYEGYVQFNQPVMLGKQQYLISALLEMVNQAPFTLDVRNCA